MELNTLSSKYTVYIPVAHQTQQTATNLPLLITEDPFFQIITFSVVVVVDGLLLVLLLAPCCTCRRGAHG